MVEEGGCCLKYGLLAFPRYKFSFSYLPALLLCLLLRTDPAPSHVALLGTTCAVTVTEPMQQYRCAGQLWCHAGGCCGCCLLTSFILIACAHRQLLYAPLH